MIRCETITLTTGATGAGTADSTAPWSGEILSIAMRGTALNSAGGTADYTFTRVTDGGTVLALTNATAPWQYQPRDFVHTTTGGTTVYGVSASNVITHGIPIDGYLRCVVAQAGSATSANVFVYFEDARG